MIIKVPLGEDEEAAESTRMRNDNTTRKLSEEPAGGLLRFPLVKIRKHKVNIDGEDREIVLIRDFSDQINIEKILL